MLVEFAKLELQKKGELYKMLYLKIKEAAECGAIKEGEKLPSVREAAEQLGVSRTTVENAYTRLCIEGLAESRPQRGYYITANRGKPLTATKKVAEKYNVLYDFSSRSVDTAATDTELWKRTLRAVLWDSSRLTAYGDRQGEAELREALSNYSYKARGVKAEAENIVIGAGIGPLLNILCGILGRKITVGIENGGFLEAEGIFSDYGIKTVLLDSDVSGATIKSIEENEIDVLFLLPSALSKISVSSLYSRRNDYIKWANAVKGRLIIEDDYNGELRYTARTVASFQGKCPEKTIYIGSFSKLLLPSVRIAYMVLPHELTVKLNQRKAGYNQTCGKIEQLALAEYITRGAMEKQLRRLRRIYYNKSQILCKALKAGIKNSEITLYESSLMLELATGLELESDMLCDILLKNGIKVIRSAQKGKIRLCFAGISEEKIPVAAQKIAEVITEDLKRKNY